MTASRPVDVLPQRAPWYIKSTGIWIRSICNYQPAIFKLADNFIEEPRQ